MSVLSAIETSSSADIEPNGITANSTTESSSKITHVDIRFTLALAVPAGKFYERI
jgi:hypothetical protein